jgi:predicted nucleotidyltransferase component of viral defense system
MTPAEIALVIMLLEQAITAGKDLYDAAQLKDMVALQVKLTAQLAQTTTDRGTANADIDARDKALEKELSTKPTP